MTTTHTEELQSALLERERQMNDRSRRRQAVELERSEWREAGQVDYARPDGIARASAFLFFSAALVWFALIVWCLVALL